jgi:hypothetical protein
MKLRLGTRAAPVGIYTGFLMDASLLIWQPSAVAPDASGRLGEGEDGELGRKGWLLRGHGGHRASYTSALKASIPRGPRAARALDMCCAPGTDRCKTLTVDVHRAGRARGMRHSRASLVKLAISDDPGNCARQLSSQHQGDDRSPGNRRAWRGRPGLGHFGPEAKWLRGRR